MRPRGSSLSFRRPAVAPSDSIRNNVGHRACEDLETQGAEAPGRGAGGSGGGGGSGGAGATRARERPPVDRVRRLRRPGGRRRPASRPCRRLGAPAAADVRGACGNQVAARERKGPERVEKDVRAPGPLSTPTEASFGTPRTSFSASSPCAGRTGRQRPEGEAPRSSLRRRAVGRHAPGGGAAPRRPPRWQHS